jgi:hypothetical protein
LWSITHAHVRVYHIGGGPVKDFFLWYSESEKVCKYCGLTEQESQEIVMMGLLKSKRFPQNGVIGQGTNRCVWLEIDKRDPNGIYSRENSVLCCYFCNNDKSDVIHGDHYTMFFQNRVEYLRQLLKSKK